jgi:hypothetical protein
MGFLDWLFRPPGKEKFAAMMTRVLRDAGETRSMRYDPADFRLTLEGDQTNSFYLHNIYAEYLSTPRSERKALLARYGAFSQQARIEEVGSAQAREQLLPRVRERFYHESLRLMAEAQGDAAEGKFPPTRLLNEQLTLELVLDKPDAVQTVGDGQLEEWGWTWDEAMAIARENLWKLSKKGFELLAPGLYYSTAADTHDASRMYLHDLVWQHPVKGKHIAMVPNRNALLVTGSDDAEGLAHMAKAARDVLGQPRAMTGVAFELEGKEWRPWLPRRSSPLRAAFEGLAVDSMARDFEEQAGWLEKIVQRQGREVFVAKAAFYQRKADETFFSLGSWAEGVPTMLPKVDFVMMGAQRNGKLQTVGFAQWERMEKAAGDLLKKIYEYPPRFMVEKFPTEQQLAAMDLSAETP